MTVDKKGLIEKVQGLLGILVVIIAGAIAWGATNANIEHLEKRIEKIDLEITRLEDRVDKERLDSVGFSTRLDNMANLLKEINEDVKILRRRRR